MACKMLFFDYRQSEEQFFKDNKFENYDIKFIKESLNNLTISDLSDDDLENTMIISVNSSSKIDFDVISKFKNLRLISTRSKGYDHICLNSCIRKNITVINVDNYGTNAVAQFTMGMIIQLVRRICTACKSENNPFIPKDFCGRDLDTLTLGIIGTGTVGANVCKYAKAFDMKIYAYDSAPSREIVDNYEVEYIHIEELLKTCDVVVVLIPYHQENYHMFSYEEFKKMKYGSYFINISRGELVDNEALLEVAKTGKFKGIGLDVVSCPNPKSIESTKIEVTSENCTDTSETIKELAKLPNVIITPQIAYDTQESINYILKTTFEGLGEFLKGGRKHRVY